MRSSSVFCCALVWGVAAGGQSTQAQGLLDLTGTSILAPVIAPTGGYGENPQEYLSVAWSVTENPSHVYTYSYTVENPAGDVLLNPDGSLTTTPEVFSLFSIGFETAQPGAYLAGSQTGSPFEEVNSVDLAWFFNPSIAAGASTPTVSFQSDLPPAMGDADAADGAPPSPWSSVSPGGSQVPVPDLAVPEPRAELLLGAILGFGMICATPIRSAKTGN